MGVHGRRIPDITDISLHGVVGWVALTLTVHKNTPCHQ